MELWITIYQSNFVEEQLTSFLVYLEMTIQQENYKKTTYDIFSQFYNYQQCSYAGQCLEHHCLGSNYNDENHLGQLLQGHLSHGPLSNPGVNYTARQSLRINLPGPHDSGSYLGSNYSKSNYLGAIFQGSVIRVAIVWCQLSRGNCPVIDFW